MYEVANTNTTQDTSWHLTKNKRMLGLKHMQLEKTIISNYVDQTGIQQMRTTHTLMPTFVNESRYKGLCYFCDEPYLLNMV